MKTSVFVLACLCASVAVGQTGSRRPEPLPVVIMFDDDVLEGTPLAPDVEFVEATRAVQHSKLIKVREDFRSKVMQSAGEL